MHTCYGLCDKHACLCMNGIHATTTTLLSLQNNRANTHSIVIESNTMFRGVVRSR